ncbi:hypothetical protein [Paenibacillus sp. P36]|uniref:hypothetical protein n=1 Tax=Paenibacillus sp. P36 TaxID=3342538 RepID=UPI0038B27475
MRSYQGPVVPQECENGPEGRNSAFRFLYVLQGDHSLIASAKVAGKTTVNLCCSVAGNKITVETPAKSPVGDENWAYSAKLTPENLAT